MEVTINNPKDNFYIGFKENYYIKKIIVLYKKKNPWNVVHTIMKDNKKIHFVFTDFKNYTFDIYSKTANITIPSLKNYAKISKIIVKYKKDDGHFNKPRYGKCILSDNETILSKHDNYCIKNLILVIPYHNYYHIKNIIIYSDEFYYNIDYSTIYSFCKMRCMNNNNKKKLYIHLPFLPKYYLLSNFCAKIYYIDNDFIQEKGEIIYKKKMKSQSIYSIIKEKCEIKTLNINLQNIYKLNYRKMMSIGNTSEIFRNIKVIFNASKLNKLSSNIWQYNIYPFLEKDINYLKLLYLINMLSSNTSEKIKVLVLNY